MVIYREYRLGYPLHDDPSIDRFGKRFRMILHSLQWTMPVHLANSLRSTHHKLIASPTPLMIVSPAP